MIPAEAAHDTVAALGDVGLLQFRDLNEHKSAFQRNYANQARTRAEPRVTAAHCHAGGATPVIADAPADRPAGQALRRDGAQAALPIRAGGSIHHRGF